MAASLDDIDNFDVDDFNDPFASGDENGKPGQASQSQSKKRGADDAGLGIDEAVAVHKKARAPAVKLDENKLLSENGIPKLRRRAAGLKFKGKGHEFSDAEQLLSFYQTWLDDLFPKGKFLDSLAMIEKAGHRSRVVMARLDWINEGRPKNYGGSSPEPEEGAANDDQPEERDPAVFPARVAPIFQSQVCRASARPTTPQASAEDDPFGDLFGAGAEEDLYDATPRRAPPAAGRTVPVVTGGLFGNGSGNVAEDNGEPDEDDLDALMAEEAAQRTTTAPKSSLFGNGPPLDKGAKPAHAEPDDDDLDAFMAAAEAESGAKPTAGATKSTKAPVDDDDDDDDDDDLDALMAEAEAQGSRVQSQGSKAPKPSAAPAANNEAFDADEEALAEMEGLW